MRLSRRRRSGRVQPARRVAARPAARRLPSAAVRGPTIHRRAPGVRSNGASRGYAAHRSSLTGRAAALVLVLAAVAITLAYPLRGFLSQRAEIHRLEQQQRADGRVVAALEQANRRWADPEYVRSQARQRLRFVLPGETAYTLLLPPSGSASEGAAASDWARRTGPWYERLWSSVELAGLSPGSG